MEAVGVKVLTNEGAVDDGEIEVALVGATEGFIEGLLGVREGRPEGVIVGEALGFRVEGELLGFVVGG